MMMLFLVTLLVIFSTVSSSSAISSEGVIRPGRLYLWSWADNSPKFSTQYVTKSMGIEQAVNHVKDVVDGYEVVVLLTPEMEENKDLCPFVQQSIQHAPSAQIMHNVYPTSGKQVLGDSLSSLLSHSSANQPSTFQRKPLVEVEELLEKNPHMLNDGKADIFVSPVSSKQDVVEFSLTSRILLEKNPKVLFISYDEVQAVPQVESKRALSKGGYSRLLAESSDLADGADYKPEGGEYSIYYQAKYLYITPDIFTGLMTFLFVSFTLFIGLSCLGSIQGMSSFYDKLPSVGKEA